MRIDELRCPRYQWSLLAKLVHAEDRQVSADGQYVEIACDACRGKLRKRGLIVSLVVHRFDLTGHFVETMHY